VEVGGISGGEHRKKDYQNPLRVTAYRERSDIEEMLVNLGTKL